MSNEMHPDLEWLARNVSEWNSQCHSVYRIDDCPAWSHFEPKKDESYSKGQWLQARKDLGLIMTEEEAELPAQEWAGSITDSEEEAEALEDMVNHPKHYQLRDGYEVYDLRQDLARKAQAAGVPHDQFSDWDRALEYLLRMWDKSGVEDAKKGAWYVNKLIGKLELSALRAEELEG